MDTPSERWNLAEAIDLEAALAEWDGSKPTSIPPQDRADHRSRVFKSWLETTPVAGLGARLLLALGTVALLVAVVFFGLGLGAAWATLDRSVDGVHVVWFLAATLLLPWLLFLAGLLGWLLRGRHSFGWLGGLLKRMTSKFVTGETARLLTQAKAGGEPGVALGWRLARHSQTIAAAFSLGAVTGLAVMVLFKQVGFFWETTTQSAMQSILEGVTQTLSTPWAWAFPDLVPDVTTTRRGPDWSGGGESWWPFLLLTLLVWGALPRLVLAGLAAWRERKTLARRRFQAPHHRRLWRVLTHVERGEDPAGPVDGALVISMGGSEPDHDALRPFLLRRLRLNPARWERLGVLDAGQEAAAREALEKAPAGIVLLTEGWALSPRQMEQTLRSVMPQVKERRLVLLVANHNEHGRPLPPTAAERVEWERFIDNFSATEIELAFFEEETP